MNHKNGFHVKLTLYYPSDKILILYKGFLEGVPGFLG